MIEIGQILATLQLLRTKKSYILLAIRSSADIERIAIFSGRIFGVEFDDGQSGLRTQRKRDGSQIDLDMVDIGEIHLRKDLQTVAKKAVTGLLVIDIELDLAMLSRLERHIEQIGQAVLIFVVAKKGEPLQDLLE